MPLDPSTQRMVTQLLEGNKVSNPKKIAVKPIPKTENDNPNQIYLLMNEIVAGFHPMIATANIHLFWHYDVKPDRDGHVCLGKAIIDHIKTIHPNILIIQNNSINRHHELPGLSR